MSTAGFQWPWQYNFPPFFTIQPNCDTRSKQMDAWCDLILAFYKHQGKSTLRVADAQSSELFCNKTLSRSLSQKDIMEVLSILEKRGNLEWQDKSKTSCTIVWKTAGQWADTIYAWIHQRGMVNTPFTIFELCHGEDTEGQEFHGIEEHIFLSALRVLERRGKAEVIGGDGVKFFI